MKMDFKKQGTSSKQASSFSSPSKPNAHLMTNYSNSMASIGAAGGAMFSPTIAPGSGATPGRGGGKKTTTPSSTAVHRAPLNNKSPWKPLKNKVLNNYKAGGTSTIINSTSNTTNNIFAAGGGTSSPGSPHALDGRNIAQNFVGAAPGLSQQAYVGSAGLRGNIDGRNHEQEEDNAVEQEQQCFAFLARMAAEMRAAKAFGVSQIREDQCLLAWDWLLHWLVLQYVDSRN